MRTTTVDVKRHGFFAVATLIAAIFLLSLPAVAAQDSDQAKSSDDSDPAQWVWIGYDWDDDGEIDYGEYIFTYDLKEAQKKSQMRSQSQKDQNRQMAQRSADSRSQMDRRSGQSSGRKEAMTSSNRMGGNMQNVSGRVKTLKRVNLVGMDRKQAIARVQTQSGRTARVYLGAADNLRKIDLQEGDRISVQGHRGKVNDKGMLIARQIRANDRQIQVKPAKGGGLQKLSGEILKVKTASFTEGPLPDQVFARIKLDDNLNTVVELGPEDQLQGLNPKELEGKQVTLLAHRANIGGATALVAHQLRVDDKTIDIDWARLAQSQSSGQTQSQQ